MVMNMDSTEIYRFIEENNMNWKVFARTKLGLSDLETEECLLNNPGDIVEQRYQMIQKWRQKQGRRGATNAKLWELVENPTHQAEAAQSASVSYMGHPAQSNVASNLTTLHQSNSDHPHLDDMNDASAAPKQHLSKENPAGRSKTFVSTPEQKLKSGASGSPAHRKSSVAKDIFPIIPYGAGGSEKLKDDAGASSSSEWTGSGESIEKIHKKSSFGQIFKNPIKLFSGKKSSKSKVKKTVTSSKMSQGNYCDEVSHVEVQRVTEQDMKRWEEIKIEDRYPTDKNKGCVLIINNSFSHDKDRFREGSDVDVKNMYQLWKQMGCDIHKKEPQLEKTADQMKELLEEMTHLRQEYSFLVIIIMTHGDLENGEVVFHGVDDKSVSVPKIQDIFNNANAHQVRGIPKLFILQFCCGSKVDRGVKTDYVKIDRSIKRLFSEPGQGVVQLDGGIRLPSVSDTLIVYPAQKGNAALRDPYYGSWLITAITNVFMKYARCESVSSMLIKVNNAMQNKDGKYEEEVDGKKVRLSVKAMSKEETTLTKHFFLLPGYER